MKTSRNEASLIGFSLLGAVNLSFLKPVLLTLYSWPSASIGLNNKSLFSIFTIFYFVIYGIVNTTATLSAVLNDLSVFLAIIFAYLSKLKAQRNSLEKIVIRVSYAFLLATVIVLFLRGGVLYELGGRVRIYLPYGTAAGAMMATFILGFLLHFFNFTSRRANVLIVLFVLMIILSGARMPAALMVFLIINKFVARRIKRSKFKLSLYLLLVTLSVFSIVGVSYAVGINSSGRFALWAIIISEKMTFFGNGLGAISELLTSFSTSSDFSQPHNDFIRVYYNHGLIGLLLIGFQFAKLLKRTIQQKDEVSIWLIPLVLGFMLTDNFLVYPFCYTLAIFGFRINGKI